VQLRGKCKRHPAGKYNENFQTYRKRFNLFLQQRAVQLAHDERVVPWIDIVVKEPSGFGVRAGHKYQLRSHDIGLQAGSHL
jgi:hypothetical protein